MQVENVIGGSLLHLRRAVVVEPSQRNLPQVLYQHGAHVNAKIGVGVMAAAGGHAEQHPSRRRARDGDQNPHRQHVGRGNAFRDGQLGNARDCEVGDELARRRQGRDGDVAYDPPFTGSIRRRYVRRAAALSTDSISGTLFSLGNRGGGGASRPMCRC